MSSAFARLQLLTRCLSRCVMLAAAWLALALPLTGRAHAGALVPINANVKFSCPSGGVDVPVTDFVFDLQNSTVTTPPATQSTIDVNQVWPNFCGTSATSNCQPFSNVPPTATFGASHSLIWNGGIKMLNASAYGNPTYHFGYGVVASAPGGSAAHTVSGKYLYSINNTAATCQVIPPYSYIGSGTAVLPTASPTPTQARLGDTLSHIIVRPAKVQEHECTRALGIARSSDQGWKGFHRKVRLAVWHVDMSKISVLSDEQLLELAVADSPLIAELEPKMDTLLTFPQDGPAQEAACIDEQPLESLESTAYFVATSFGHRAAWGGSLGDSTVFTILTQDFWSPSMDEVPANLTPTPVRLAVKKYLPWLNPLPR